MSEPLLEREPGTVPVRLGVQDAPALLELCSRSLPDESLSLDDLEGVAFAPDGPDALDTAVGRPSVRRLDAATFACFDEEGVPIGAASVSSTDVFGFRQAHLQLLVVHPARRRRGVARALVAAAESWAAHSGSSTLTIGAGAPFYLFTGVDTRWTEALCCFEALGYDRVATELDLVCPTLQSRPTSSGQETGPTPIVVSRVADAADAAELDVWVRSAYPHWAAEFARAAAAATVVVARDDSGRVVGAAAHSVSRFGVIGPVAVDATCQRAGVGARLMGAVVAELSVAGLRRAEIAWTSTVRFYARVCAARVGRTSVVLRRELGE